MTVTLALVISLFIVIVEPSPSLDFNFHRNFTTLEFEQSKCTQIWSDNTRKYVTCCRVKKGNEEKVKCLPSFIIAGVQKAGTTALAALLAGIDQISFSKKKEVHFFDNTENYELGIDKYLESFNPWSQLTPPLFGESTPFYIASRDACQRISDTIPNIKMIVLLREPVSRAYSEYQMKKR